MYISCKNINDFCTMITTCSLNTVKDIRLFISTKLTAGSVAFASDPKDFTSFTYALFTPLYTAIYTGSVRKELYEENIFNPLLKCQEQCNHSFDIQVFKNLSFNSDNGCLYIEDELKII